MEGPGIHATVAEARTAARELGGVSTSEYQCHLRQQLDEKAYDLRQHINQHAQNGASLEHMQQCKVQALALYQDLLERCECLLLAWQQQHQLEQEWLLHVPEQQLQQILGLSPHSLAAGMHELGGTGFLCNLPAPRKRGREGDREGGCERESARDREWAGKDSLEADSLRSRPPNFCPPYQDGLVFNRIAPNSPDIQRLYNPPAGMHGSGSIGCMVSLADVEPQPPQVHTKQSLVQFVDSPPQNSSTIAATPNQDSRCREEQQFEKVWGQHLNLRFSQSEFSQNEGTDARGGAGGDDRTKGVHCPMNSLTLSIGQEQTNMGKEWQEEVEANCHRETIADGFDDQITTAGSSHNNGHQTLTRHTNQSPAQREYHYAPSTASAAALPPFSAPGPVSTMRASASRRDVLVKQLMLLGKNSNRMRQALGNSSIPPIPADASRSQKASAHPVRSRATSVSLSIVSIRADDGGKGGASSEGSATTDLLEFHSIEYSAQIAAGRSAGLEGCERCVCVCMYVCVYVFVEHFVVRFYI